MEVSSSAGEGDQYGSDAAADDSIEVDEGFESMDSEEEAFRGSGKQQDEAKESRKVGKVQDRESTKNKLRLGDFHRNATFKPRQRKVTTKKQIRDIERLLDREGLPEEVRKAKKAQLVQLKKEAKKKREAELFESKYKKIKFTEKRKVIRQMESIKSGLSTSKDLSDQHRVGMQESLKELQDQLTYINFYPTTIKITDFIRIK